MIKRLLAMVAVIGVTILSMVFAPATAWAGKRVALIIGNSTYQTVPQLPNPSRDATSVAKMFRDAGFETVDLVLNVGNLEFKRAIRKFEAAADQAEMAVVYYAGHGLEVGATNYLIPVDARLASDRDADDEAISLERLVSSADGASRLRLIILDACRDNPFVGTMRRERKVASRGVTAGLGKVEPTSSDTLIAYAAKAGSTADDGDGQHSPFTAAILKDLTVPGLDVRLAFGRVRDDVLKTTGNRQEPFVYGSLGGGNVSLVPAPEKPQEVPVNEVKADYELVQKIGTRRAWEVFLGTHSTGFYAELAKAQIERISSQPAGAVPAAPPQPPAAPVPNITVAALPEQKPPNREASSREAAEWDKVKDATDPTLLQKFIGRFPDSPLALNAQQRIDVLKRAQADRDEQARQAAEQARQAAEEAKRKAAEAAAQKKRDDDARRAAETEAAERAKAAAAALAAQKKRDDDERRAAAAEAERQAKAADAARKAQEAQQKAEQAEHDKATAAAAVAAAAAEKQAREAEAARKKAELAAQKETTCKDEQSKLEAILTKGSDGSGTDDLKSFSKTVTCDRLGPVVVAAIDRFSAEAVKRAAVAPNSPQLVASAQGQLIRLGCMTGKADGTLNPLTTTALTRYLTIEGQPTDKPTVTQDLVSELGKHTTRVCPIECKSGETLKGETCVADKPAETAPATASRKSDDNDDTPRRKQAKTQPDREQPRKQRPAAAAAPEAPRARAQALARPSIVSGGGGGGGAHTMIGVGF
jgi:membrane protein involved in colicin uptake